MGLLARLTCGFATGRWVSAPDGRLSFTCVQARKTFVFAEDRCKRGPSFSWPKMLVVTAQTSQIGAESQFELHPAIGCP